MRVHVDDSIRTNRLLVAVLAVGLVAVLFALPKPVAGATQGLGAAGPPSLRAGVRKGFPPSPTQSGGSSVDAILVFVNDSGSPSYSFRGHSPAVPLPVDAPLVWSWFSGNPGSPNVTGPGASRYVRPNDAGPCHVLAGRIRRRGVGFSEHLRHPDLSRRRGPDERDEIRHSVLDLSGRHRELESTHGRRRGAREPVESDLR